MSLPQDIEMFKCSLCADLLHNPATLPCGHNICMHHVPNIVPSTGHSGKCPECRAKISSGSNIGVNKLLKSIIETSYPSLSKKRATEISEELVVQTEVKRYINSTRLKMVHKIVLQYVGKRCIASYDEINDVVQKTLKDNEIVAFPDEGRTACMLLDSTKIGITEWGIFTSDISRHEWIVFALSFLYRLRKSPSEDTTIDPSTGLEIPTDFLLTPSEKELFANITLTRELYISAWGDPRYTEIKRILDQNTPPISSSKQSYETLYKNIKDFKEISNDIYNKYTASLPAQLPQRDANNEFQMQWDIPIGGGNLDQESSALFANLIGTIFGLHPPRPN